MTYSWNIHKPNQYQEWTGSILLENICSINIDDRNSSLLFIESSSFWLFPDIIPQDVVPSHGETDMQLELPDLPCGRSGMPGCISVSPWEGTLRPSTFDTWAADLLCDQTFVVVTVVAAQLANVFWSFRFADGKPQGYISTPEASVYEALWIPWETSVWPRCRVKTTRMSSGSASLGWVWSQGCAKPPCMQEHQFC